MKRAYYKGFPANFVKNFRTASLNNICYGLFLNIFSLLNYFLKIQIKKTRPKINKAKNKYRALTLFM